MLETDAVLKPLLEIIYGPARAPEALRRIKPVIEAFPRQERKKKEFFSAADTILITYGNTLKHDGRPPLAVLGEFGREFLRGSFSAVHLLPFFPYSSDDGFSVTDYYTVNPELGTWDDVAGLRRDFELMVDCVLNHISSRSDWFMRYLAGEEGFSDLAIETTPGEHLKNVTRPRTTPLLTEFTKKDGTRVYVWTTFSADQVDLNYRSLDVLEKMIDVLLFYVKHGASLIRLDAIAYLWKEPGTSCIHLPQTHAMVKLFRAILDIVAPDTRIVTETNVPHAENISYFGNGSDEAQMVYNFTLPPLLLYSFLREDTTAFSEWAATLRLPSDKTAFLNFTASHDGIGVRPLEGILPESEAELLIRHTIDNGGQVSYKSNPDGSKTAYELNITYMDALSPASDDARTRASRFLASCAIQFALPGVPAVYIHSLLGSRNWTEGVRMTGMARTINRQTLQYDDVMAEIKTPGTLRNMVFHGCIGMLETRRRQPAFHPNAPFEVLMLDPGVFAIRRWCDSQNILAVTNVSGKPVSLDLPLPGTGPFTDLVSGRVVSPGVVTLAPFRFLWLTDNPC